MIVLAIGENVPVLTSDAAKTAFTRAVARLLDELKEHGQPLVFVRSTFWANAAKDQALQKAAEGSGAVFVDLGGLDQDPANFADSERKFEHAGVGHHPGDRGMQAISDVIWAAIAKRAATEDGP